MSETPSLTDSAPVTLDVLQQYLADLRQFVTRRFDEISFEINATGQIVGMSEETMAARFTEVLLTLNAIAFKGEGRTPHNVGVELDAVVKTTEDAANKILDAASLINGLTKKPVNWSNEKERTEWLALIDKHANDILAACAFQDLTGQRIARTLDNIRQAEADLTDTLKRMGINIIVSQEQAMKAAGMDKELAQCQADIDAILAKPRS